MLEVSEEQNWIRQVHTEVKLIFALSISLVTILTSKTLFLIFLFLLSLLILLSGRLSISKGIIKSSLIILFTTIISQAFFYYEYYTQGKGTVLIYIFPPDIPIVSTITLHRGIAITLEGLIYGVNIGLKITITIIVSCIFIFTTKLSEIVSIGQRLKIPLKVIIAFIFTLRFIPMVIQELKRVLIVLKMKGEKISIRNFVRIVTLSLRNVMYGLILKSYIFAFVLETRCIQWKIPILPESKVIKYDLILVFLSIIPWLLFLMS